MKKILFLLITLSCFAQAQDILDPWKNFALVQARHGYDSDATTIVLVANDGAKLPQPSTDSSFYMVYWDWFAYRYWWKSDPYAEIVKVTARSGDTLTVARAQLGTTARNHNTYGRTYKLALDFFTDFRDKLDSVLKLHRDSIRDVANYGATGVGDTTFKWSVSGSAQVTDSLRFVAGTGVSLSRTGNAVTITNTSADSAGESDTSRASYWATELRNTNLRRTTPAYTAETDKYLRADSTWVTPSGVGDITAVNTNLPLSGGVTSGAATLSVDTSNATYGLTNLRVNALNQLDTDTSTVDATRYWVLNSAGVITGVTVGNGLTGGGSTGDITIGVDSTVLATQYDLTTATTSDSSRAAYIADTAKNVDSAKYATQFDILNVRRTVPAYTSAGTTFLRDDSTWAAPTADSVRIADTARASYWSTKVRADSVQKADTARASYWATKLRPDSTQKADTARASYWASNVRGNYIKPADTTTQRTYSNTLYAQDTLNLIAGEGLTGGGELSADRTFAIDTTSSRIATQYDITQIDSNKVIPYSLASWNIDSNYTIYIGGAAGKIAYFVTAESVSYSNYDATLLDTTQANSYTTKAAATNATNLTSGTLPAARLPATGVTAGSYTNSDVTVDDYGRITTISSGGGGSGSGNVTSGDNTFTTTATSDTISITGAHSYDQYVLTPISITPNWLPGTTNIMSYYPDTNRVIVNRAVGDTSGLNYSWIRNVGTFAPPTNVDVAAEGDDTLIVSWTAPATTSASTARPLDSIAIAYDTSGYCTTIATAVNIQYAAKTATADTLTGLTAEKLWYVNVFSYSYANEGSVQSASSRDTCTTGAPTGTQDTIRADELSGLVAWYEGRFITGTENGAGITSWIDHSTGGRTLDTITGKTGSLPIYYSSVAGQFNSHPAVGFNALNVNDSCGLHSSTVATDSFSGSSAHAMTIVAVMNIPDSNYKQTNYTAFDFSNSSNYQMDVWGGHYRTSTLKTMKYAINAPAPDSSDTRSTNIALGTYTLPAHIYTWRYDGDSLTQWIDETKIDSGRLSQSNVTFDRFSLGYHWVLTAKEYYAPYNVAAFIIYKGEKTDAELATLRARLKAYYATP